MISSGNSESKLTRVGVFYDGNYFLHVSNYYAYQHERKARISIAGLHKFIAHEVSEKEAAAERHCRIVDAHYFRGRLSADKAQSRGILHRERAFDEILMREGIVSHFLPLAGGSEKGIDVWLALEAFELAIYKRFDVVVLIAGDGDYLPLIRKVSTIGARLMVLGWDFSYTDTQGNERTTRTAQSILDEATYPILMHRTIDDRSRKKDPLIDGLFVQYRNERFNEDRNNESISDNRDDQMTEGRITNIREGYGFIEADSDSGSFFFHYTDLENIDFNHLNNGDRVKFIKSKNNRGACAKSICKI